MIPNTLIGQYLFFEVTPAAQTGALTGLPVMSTAFGPILLAPTVNSQKTSDTTPTVTGTATLAAGETLYVIVNDVTYTGTDLTWNGNSWSLTVADANALLSQTYEVTAT